MGAGHDQHRDSSDRDPGSHHSSMLIRPTRMKIADSHEPRVAPDFVELGSAGPLIEKTP